MNSIINNQEKKMLKVKIFQKMKKKIQIVEMGKIFSQIKKKMKKMKTLNILQKIKIQMKIIIIKVIIL